VGHRRWSPFIIRGYRLMAGLSRGGLAAKAGVCEATVVGWESGRARTFVNLDEVLGVTADAVYQRLNKPPKRRAVEACKAAYGAGLVAGSNVLASLECPNYHRREMARHWQLGYDEGLLGMAPNSVTIGRDQQYLEIDACARALARIREEESD